MREFSEEEQQILEYYYKSQKKKRIIIIVFIILMLIIGGSYLGYKVYLAYNNTYRWETKIDNIVLEYGEKFKLPELSELIDTKKYTEITKDNTSISCDIKNEDNKEYPAVGKYQIITKHNEEIRPFSFLKIDYVSQKEITLEIKDTTAPKLKKPDKIEVMIGTKISSKDYKSLFECEDLSKTEDISIDLSKVDINTKGDYKAKVIVSDIYGNKASEEVIFSVIGEKNELPQNRTESTTEILNEATTTEPTTSTQTQTTTTKTITSEQPTTKEETSSKVEIKNYPDKDFLFTDGYTLQNVLEAASKYLKESGRAGICEPIQDEDGVYLGMRVTFND